DLVHEAVPLSRRHRGVGRVVGAAYVDATRRAHTGTELAADALLHPVLVSVQDVTAVLAFGLGRLLGREALGDAPTPHLPQRHPEAREPAHYRISSSTSSRRGIDAHRKP